MDRHGKGKGSHCDGIDSIEQTREGIAEPSYAGMRNGKAMKRIA